MKRIGQILVIHFFMLKRPILVFLFFFTIGHSNYAQNQVDVLSFDEFKTGYLEKQSDTLFVINFWATWCKPCVQEMPYFLEAEEKFGGEKFKLLLVSLDFKTDLESKLIPFLEKKSISSDVVLLDDLDYNSWIDKVSENWSGAIPATLFLNQEKGIYTFKEGEFEKEKLLNQISQLL